MKITAITAENINEQTREALEEAAAEADARLEELLAIDDADLTAENIAEARELSAAIDLVEERVAALDAEAQATADELAAMRERRAARNAAPETTDEAVEEPGDEAEQPETDETAEVVETVETAPEVVAETTEVIEAPAVETPAAVAASARRPLAGRRPAPAPERQQKENTVDLTPVLVASAENGLVAAGAKVGIADFQRIARAKLNSARGSQGRIVNQVGTFQIQSEEALRVGEKSTQDQMNEAIERAVSMSRVKEAAGLTASASDAEALVAAGWCAPSETVYDLCENGSREGLFELPEIVVNRGGINFTQGLDFSPLYSDATFGWDITEAEMDAETFSKDCVSVPCPDFDEVRLNAVGFCVTSDLLPKAAYPELEQQFLAETLIAFDHKKSRKYFTAVRTAAGAAISAGDQGSVASSTLLAVELVVEGERRKYRWPRSQVMEAVAPHWLQAAFRADLAARTGVDKLAVTDAEIDSYFAARNIRIQYIYDYTGSLLAEGTAVLPATAEVIVYKAGTFVGGTAPVINLSTVYDSTLLAQNKHMALFYEQGILVLQRCYGARRITIPVCAVGRTGAADVTCVAGP